ncbi:NAD(P)H-binding protein [Nocardia stercoris]|uniref:NmrA family transcriptional regulator n=1 Tax=Nocardia stercoris TaxID=2483361 RepID=A0A3M2LEF8_9NOCA|nr:NAD(P)H-binding protein [Nocardia stercoris]RMI35852.1 NmrA family transcriptional regulator [Nocardia stercoris]
MTHILVLGGTGKTGRRVAQHLTAAGHRPRTAARSGADLAVDLGDPATWAAAVDGAEAVYLVEPQLQFEPAGRQRIPRFVAAAVAAGVRRLVLLSAPGAGHPDHPLHAAEAAVRESGIDWTVLRPNWFAQNFSESFWRADVLAGVLSLPAGAGGAPFVDAEDIAAVAARALTGDEFDGGIYELTGPRAIGFAEAVELIGAATGRDVRYVPGTVDEFVALHTGFGVPEPAARLLAGILGDLADGVGATVTSDVSRALGRPAGTFEDFVTRAAAAGAWVGES